MAVPARDSHRKLAKANHLLVQGQLDEACRLCEEVILEHPNEIDAYLLMAKITTDKGDEQEALHWSRMAADLAPDLGKVESLRLSLEERLNAEQAGPAIKVARKKIQALVFSLGCLVLMTLAVWVAYTLGGKPEVARTTIRLDPLVIEMRPAPQPVSSEPLPMASHLSVSPSAADVRLYSAILERVGSERQIFVSSADQHSGLLLSVMALEQDDPLKCAAFFALALEEIIPGQALVIHVLQRRQVVLIARTIPRPSQTPISQKRFRDPAELDADEAAGLFVEVQRFELASEEHTLSTAQVRSGGSPIGQP